LSVGDVCGEIFRPSVASKRGTELSANCQLGIPVTAHRSFAGSSLRATCSRFFSENGMTPCRGVVAIFVLDHTTQIRGIFGWSSLISTDQFLLHSIPTFFDLSSSYTSTHKCACCSILTLYFIVALGSELPIDPPRMHVRCRVSCRSAAQACGLWLYPIPIS
jgi:hypothetical protein